MSQSDRIDVHHHLIPPAFVNAMEARGLHEVAGARLPRWSARKSLQNMDVHGIATALLSLSAPGVHLGGSVTEACDLARACNEFAAETIQQHPGRFGFFAVLPMPFTDQACAEAVYALDVLGADGVVLLGSTDGQFLGDPRFDALMAELNCREAVVFVHPNLHPGTEALGLSIPGFLVEFLCDTTRAACNLMFSGTLDQYPRIRWILAHAGGFLPYIAWRLSLANALPALKRRVPRGVLHYIRQFHFDTALSPSPYAMATLSKLVAPERILFGSDYPFAPAVITGLEVQSLAALDIFDVHVKAGIARDHALALFPRLAAAGPVESPSGPASRVRRWLAGPVEALAEHLRDR
ncbi:amidohydrolase family protein [Frateuria aurantia]